MKWVFITIGVILLIGGVSAVRNPRPWTATFGGHRYNPNMSVQAMPRQSASYLGYATIGLGIASVLLGLKYRAIVGAPNLSIPQRRNPEGGRQPLRPFRYLTVEWKHENDEDPVVVFIEADSTGWELRKIEEFRDGRLCYADSTRTSGRTQLGEEPIPSIDEIAEDAQFLPRAITRKEFEAAWKKGTV